MNVTEFILEALKEDIGSGDHTSLSCIPAEAKGKAKLLVKDQGIISGVEISKEVFRLVDADLKTEYLIKDGASVKKGDICFYVEGSSRSILQAERLVLNIMQRMSGIATHTAELNSLLAGTGTKLLDTRKTTPNFRYFEKLAVKHGGGVNHRFGLYDMILIKDNHIDYAGGISQAIKAAKAYLQKNKLEIQIEVEARNLYEVEQILQEGGIQRIMLDNFSPDEMKKAVQLINRQAETEASGGITRETIRTYAETGVDYISVGALTHSLKSLDLSLKAC